MRLVVLAVACMMVMSIIGSAGYVFPQGGAGKTLSARVPYQGSHPEEKGEEETDTHGTGLFMFGMEALGESFAPVFPPPPNEGRILPVSMLLQRSAYLPRIYRPPIS